MLGYQASVWLDNGRQAVGISSQLRDDHVRVVTVDYPPVNALPVAGWFALAAALDEAGRDPDTHVVLLRAVG